MENKYTDAQLEEFFKRFKKLPVSTPVETIEDLLQTSTPRNIMHRNFISANLKYILIYTSFILLLLVGFWGLFPKNDKSNIRKNVPILKSESTVLNIEKDTTFFTNVASSKNHIHINNTDTIINGESFVLSLSNQELSQIGFVITDSGLYYNNYFEGENSFFICGNISRPGSTWGLKRYSNYNDLEPSTFNFYPLYISGNSYEVNYEPLRKRELFDTANDTLVPVKVTESQMKGTNDLIFWFTATHQLFDRLPERYKALEHNYKLLKELKTSKPNQNLVEFIPTPVIHSSRYVELSTTELERVGFSFSNEAVSYNLQLGGMLSKMSFNSGVEMSLDEKPTPDSPLKLFFISDQYGNQPVIWHKTEDLDKMKSSYFQKKIDYLVPVIVQKKDYPMLRSDFIFWFEPTQALFDSLPSNLGKEIEAEYKSITAPAKNRTEAPECQYFSACQQSMYKDFRITPNPVKALARINFTSDINSKGRIELIDINGKKIKTLVSPIKIEKGMNSYQIDLCDIKPGIYMLLVTTHEGFQVQKVIVSR